MPNLNSLVNNFSLDLEYDSMMEGIHKLNENLNIMLEGSPSKLEFHFKNEMAYLFWMCWFNECKDCE